MATDWLHLILGELDNHYRLIGDETKLLRLEKLLRYTRNVG